MERIPEKKPFSLLPPCVCSSKNLSKPWDAWNGTKLKWRRMEVAETGRDGNAYTHTHTHTRGHVVEGRRTDRVRWSGAHRSVVLLGTTIDAFYQFLPRAHERSSTSRRGEFAWLIIGRRVLVPRGLIELNERWREGRGRCVDVYGELWVSGHVTGEFARDRGGPPRLSPEMVGIWVYVKATLTRIPKWFSLKCASRTSSEQV